MKSDSKRLPAREPKRRGLQAKATVAPESGAVQLEIAAVEISPAPDGRLVENVLRETEERYRALFDGVETGIFIIDPETHTLVDANAIAVGMVGAPREKIVGSVCHKFVCPAESGRCPVTDLGQTVDNSERILLTANGRRCAIIKTVRPVVVAGRRLLLESFLDITALKNVEKR